MVWLIECQACRYEDLKSDPQSTCKSQHGGKMFVTPALAGSEIGESLELTSQPA